MRSKTWTVETILAVSAGLTLLGWAMLHVFWDVVPYRALLWNEPLLRSFVEGNLGIPWRSWVGDARWETIVQTGVRTIGLGLAVAAVASVRNSRSLLLLCGSLVLLFCSFLSWMDSNYQIGHVIESAARVSVPFFTLVLARGWISRERAFGLLKVATAMTFTGHGLYALGFFPVPGHFIDMVIGILSVDEFQARGLLKVFGVLDLAVSVMIFVSPRLSRPALAYATVWGLVTSLARPLNYIGMGIAAPGGFSLAGLAYWTAEGLSRAAHVGIPLAALLLMGVVSVPSRSPSRKPVVRWA